MADPVSLTAAAAGFIGLAGQLAQGIIKVKEIYTTINDAPRDLAKLCSMMEALQGVLEEVGDQIQQLSRGSFNLATGTFRDAIAQCEKSRYRVEAHVKNISYGDRRNRGVGMRYVFKKKEIQEMLSDVEQCKSSLILARQSIDEAISACRHESLHQTHTILLSDNRQLLQQTSRVQTNIEAVSSQQRLDFDTISQQVAIASERSTHGYKSLRAAQRESSSKISESLRDLKNELHPQHDQGPTKAILARIEDIQRDIHASNRHLEHLVSRGSDVSHLNSARTTKHMKVGFQCILFNFSVEFSAEQENQQAESKTVLKAIKKNVCTIRLPNWFVQNQYNLAIARSKNGWLFHPSAYRVVDRDSSFFEACREGDLEKMKGLLSSKQAYLGDRVSPYPGSALSVAILYDQLGACKLLVDAGILSFFQSSDYMVALKSFAFSLKSHRTQGRRILRLIEKDQNLDPEWIDDIGLISPYYKAVQGLGLYAEPTRGSDLDRFEALIFPTMLGFDFYLSDLEADAYSLSEFLGDANHVREVRDTASCSTWILFVIARKISDLFARGDKRQREHAVRAFCSALTALCDAEYDLHARMEELPEEWYSVLNSMLNSRFAHTTPFAFMFAYHINWWPGTEEKIRFECLDEVIRLWVNTLYRAGVDLTAFAEQEVWAINAVMMRVLPEHNLACRLLHGPEPDDWRIETGPPGEVQPAYFWRSVEASPIVEDLTTKVLKLMHRVENPEAVHRDVPGSWETDWDDPDQSTWIITGWLTFLGDDDLARMEADLEGLDAEKFYEVWDINAVIEDWSYEE